MEKTLTQLWKSFDVSNQIDGSQEFLIPSSQPMGSGGNGISLDLGIGSSIDPLHLTEVTITFINSHRTIRGQELQCFLSDPSPIIGNACH